MEVRIGPGGVWAVERKGRILLRLVGGAFQEVPFPDDLALYDVAPVGASEAWAVGYRRGGGPVAMRWDGGTWTSAPVPDLTFSTGLSQVAVNASGEVWATDAFRSVTHAVSNLLRWTGSAWVRETPPSTAYGTLAFDGNDRLVLVREPGTGTGALFVRTGSGWRTTEFPSSPNVRLWDVDGAPGSPDLWMVGHRDLTPVVLTGTP